MFGGKHKQEYNVAPTTTSDAVIPHGDSRELVRVRWRLIPAWWNKPAKQAPSTFNARAESRSRPSLIALSRSSTEPIHFEVSSSTSRASFGGGAAGRAGRIADHASCSGRRHLQGIRSLKGALKKIGGSMCDDWNNILANQTVQALWFFEKTAEEEINRRLRATVSALIGIAPGDELEGMLAAQLIACHNAAMECYRRAMLPQQTFEGRQENLTQANKLSRTYSALIETINRYRGKGQQKVTVEHVHVHEGGHAWTRAW